MAKAHWTLTGKLKYEDEGCDQAGKHSTYMKVHEKTRGTDFKNNKWVEVRNKFWTVERKTQVIRGARQMMMKMTVLRQKR